VSEDQVAVNQLKIMRRQTAMKVRPFVTARWILENIFEWPPFMAPAETIHNAHQYGAVVHADKVANEALDTLLGVDS